MFNTDPVLTELWIMALAGVVNGTANVEPERHIHKDLATLLAIDGQNRLVDIEDGVRLPN